MFLVFLPEKKQKKIKNKKLILAQHQFILAKNLVQKEMLPKKSPSHVQGIYKFLVSFIHKGTRGVRKREGEIYLYSY